MISKQHVSGRHQQGEFKVILKSLRGGHGDSPEASVLWLPYSTSFELFQVKLRDATQLSVIPPILMNLAGSAQPDRSRQNSEASTRTLCVSSATLANKSRRDSEASSRTLSVTSDRRNEGRSSGDSVATNETLSSMGSTSSSGFRPHKPRNPSARGYTLDDGPWLYRLGTVRPDAAKEPYVDLVDRASYLKMIDNINVASQANQGYGTFVYIDRKSVV